MRQVAIILLTLPDGKFVFQRRSKDAPRSPGLLGLFGGHMEEGETSDEAIIREFGEETSMDIHSLQWSLVEEYFRTPPGEPPATFHIYQAEIPDMNFKVYEGDRAEVYSIEEALARDDLAHTCRYALMSITKEKQ